MTEAYMKCYVEYLNLTFVKNVISFAKAHLN